MNWSVGTAWRVFWSDNKYYRSRQLRSDLKFQHLEDGQFMAKRGVRLWSQLDKSITCLPHRLLSGR